MSHSPDDRSDPSADRQALLDLLFQEEELGEASAEEIPRRQSKEPPQLSFAQQRLWFLDQWEPGSSTYNFITAVRLTGLLNFAAFERSINEILRRHEALRTTFATVDGQPVQVVASPKAFALSVRSLQHLPENEREAEARRLVKDEQSKSFDLVKGPLFRPTLLQLGEAEHILILSMHHIVSDGWSMGILFRELTSLYAAFSAGHPSPLPELSIQYGDFAKWQREWLQGKVLERQLSYWKMQLQGIPAVSNIPTDRPRPAVQGHRGKAQYLELTKELTEGLKALSRKEGVTLFMTLLAAFQTLLCRYTSQEDIVVGSPIANRNRPEIEGLIGFFVNTLVLRTDVSGNPSFRELLGRVRKMALGAYEHEDLPFEKLVEELQPERSPSYSPLFQVMFFLQSAPNAGLEFQSLSVSPVRLDTETTRFDLTLSIDKTAPGLSGALQYNTDLFHDATITRMIGHFQILLKRIVADADLRISDLPILTEAEKHQLLVEWNDTAADYPKDRCIQQLFEAQAACTPDGVAVVFENKQLTYAELNTRANQLAHHLIALGLGPEVLVGICLERSLELIVGLLAILKAGGAYVPLDPAYPKERLAFMLTDAQVPLLLTQHALLGQLSGYPGRIVCLDRDWEAISTIPLTDPLCRATAGNLAYVIYTSGSTGKPKGVAVRQRGVIRLVCKPNYVVLSSSETIGQVSNVAFDAATFEIWGALLNGGRLAIIARDTVLAPEDFVAALERHRITCLFLTTALFNAVSLAMPQAFRGVRQLLFGGEACDPERVRAVLEAGAPETLIHVYGPTETTTFATFYPVKGVRRGDRTIPIGRPISGTRVFILDRHGVPVPVGIVGEIHIGGVGLAAGYLNRPQETDAKFIERSFAGCSNERLYSTGDLARYLPDGNIEFCGRIDDQVKIRGYRIELGEIEAVLAEHPAVSQAVAMVREDTPGDKRLVAYIVPVEPFNRSDRVGASFPE
jgi:amino acid adenylation domain-containing protein